MGTCSPCSTCVAALSLRELRGALPRAEFDVEAALSCRAPDLRGRRRAWRRPCSTLAERFDGVRPSTCACRPRSLAALALAELDPDVRAALEESIRAGPLVHADQPGATHHPGRPWRHGHRALGAGRPGRPLRPRGLAVYPSSVVMNVVPAQIARCRLPRRREPAAARSRLAGYPHPTILAACALLGVDEVYAMGGRAGRRRFAYGFTDGTAGDNPAAGAGEDELRPGQPRHRPGQHLRRRGQAAAQGRHRHRRRGRPHRDRDPRRRLRRRRPRRGRPDQPGRARPARRLGARHRQRRARRCRRGRTSPSGRGDQAHRAGHHRPDRAPVRRSCSSTTSRPASPSSTPMPRSTWRSRPR
jgi:hypothetical protein